ncbi:hypothetical protein TNCV_1512251 [Trichonephila clavipes]|nr:hypothetical protein TNCV_1512251 [Trichonephila clavipes]
MATGSYLTPIYSRSQSEVQGDLHKWISVSKGKQRTSSCYMLGSSSVINVYTLLLYCKLSVLHLYFICSQEPLLHKGTINSRRDTSPLVRLEDGEEGGDTNSPPGCCLSELGRNRSKSFCHLYGAQG